MATYAECAEELAREAAARRAAYPALIEKLRMTESGAAIEHALVATWRIDLARYVDFLALPFPRSAPAQLERSAGFTWADRRGGLQRELDRRARLYPKWIAAGQLDQVEADRRVARLSVMLEIYDNGWDWHDSFGRRPNLSIVHPDAATRETNASWLSHYQSVMAHRHGTPAQEALAL